MAERPRPLNTDATLQERVKHLEIVLFGDPDDPPPPEYIDTTAVTVPDTAITPPSNLVDRLTQVEVENQMLRQALLNRQATQ